MAAHAGEKAWKAGTFKCQVCNAEVRVREGSTIPKCPNGHATFDERINEPARERPLAGRPRKKSTATRASTSRTKTAARSRTRRSSRSSGRKSSARKLAVRVQLGDQDAYHDECVCAPARAHTAGSRARTGRLTWQLPPKAC